MMPSSNFARLIVLLFFLMPDRIVEAVAWAPSALRSEAVCQPHTVSTRAG